VDLKAANLIEEKDMTKRAGIWIDHREAKVFLMHRENEDFQIVESNIEKRLRPRGGSPSPTPYGPKDAVADDKFERKFKLQLSRYYDNVLSKLKDVDVILILGPGEAKTELSKHIENKEPNRQIVGIEAADKMTQNQEWQVN